VDATGGGRLRMDVTVAGDRSPVTAQGPAGSAGRDVGQQRPASGLFKLSVVIPAHNEERNLEPTLTELIAVLDTEHIPFEIVVVDDNSTDGTSQVAAALALRRPEIRVVPRIRLPGFGRAIRAGLAAASGDVVVIVMADRSDDPRDVARYYRKIEEGYDCVYGSRFRRGSKVENYPAVKLFVNRMVNKLVQLLFWTRFNDLTNAFKAFRREVLVECGPFSASHFNITIELSLSALIRRYNIAEIPVNWYGRTWGSSNLRLTEMGRRYLSVLLRMFFEKLLVSDDILAERLLERSIAVDRLAAFEQRLAQLEAWAREQQGSPGRA
jgi:dolichol-phosphate mannosyltransferase